MPPDDEPPPRRRPIARPVSDDDFEDDDEAEDRRRRRRRDRDREDQDAVVASIVPVNVSGYALVALYGGLIGFCLPVVGLVFAVPALVCGIVALKRWKRNDSYGAATSNVRAVIGTVLAGLGTLVWGAVLVAIAVKAAAGK